MKYEEPKFAVIYFDGDVFADLTVKSNDTSSDSGDFTELFG